LTEDEDLIS